MKIKISYAVSAGIVLAASLTLSPPAAEAQLLNRLSKGLQKVNKGIGNASKVLEDAKNTIKKDKPTTSGNPTSSQSTQTYNQPTSESGTENYTEESGTVSQPAVPQFLKEARQPTITSRTILLRKKECYHSNTLNPVSDGIFAIQEYNPKYGYAAYYGFWTIDGKRLTEARYESADGYPVFDNGAVTVKDLPDAKHHQDFLIIYTDGTARKLPANYRYVSQFRDGVAVVETQGTRTYKSERFCIDTKGNRIWRNIDGSTRAVLEVGYLSDGLRRVVVRDEVRPYSYQTRVGFVDDKGNWVLQPQWGRARDFKNGYCPVEEPGGSGKFIDKKGNTLCAIPENNNIESVSDICNGYFAACPYQGANTTFYDLSGNAVKAYRNACGFTDGYAFVVDIDSDVMYVINPKFEKVRVIGRFDDTGEWTGINNPRYGKAGLGTLVQRIVVTPEGEPKLFVSKKFWQSYTGDFWQNHIGNFYPGDYAPSTIMFEDPARGESYGWSGFIDRNGDFAVVITDDERAIRKLPGEMINGEYRVSIPQFDTIPVGPKLIN